LARREEKGRIKESSRNEVRFFRLWKWER